MSDKKKKTEVSTQKKDQSVQHAAPVSLFGPFNDMERWFADAFPARWRKHLHSDWPSMGGFLNDYNAAFEGRLPSVDVIDRDSEINVRAEIPGVDKKDLDISVTEDSVSLKGSVKHEEVEEEGEYYRRETSSGSFSRTVALPCEVDSSNVKAKFKEEPELAKEIEEKIKVAMGMSDVMVMDTSEINDADTE